MVFYDLSSDVGKIRLLIPDRHVYQEETIFHDDEIAAFLQMEGGVKRAAALALETIAVDEALVQKVMRLGNVQTDGSKTAATLLARAERLRAQAGDEEAVAGAAFDVAEWAVDPSAAGQILANVRLRGD